MLFGCDKLQKCFVGYETWVVVVVVLGWVDNDFILIF